MSIKIYHWPFSFKNASAGAHTAAALCTIKNSKGERKEQRSPHCGDQDAVDPNGVFELRMPSGSGGPELGSRVVGSLFRGHLRSPPEGVSCVSPSTPGRASASALPR